MISNSTALVVSRSTELVNVVFCEISRWPNWVKLVVPLLLASLQWLYAGFEVLSFGKFLVWLLRVVGNVFGCRCCRRKPSAWTRFVQTPFFWDLERADRHDSAVKNQWSAWAKLGNRLRNPHVGAPQTWPEWNRWSRRMQVHRWHLEKKQRASV